MWLLGKRRPKVMVARTTFIVRDAIGRPQYYILAGQCFVKEHHLVKSHRRYFKREAKT